MQILFTKVFFSISCFVKDGFFQTLLNKNFFKAPLNQKKSQHISQESQLSFAVIIFVLAGFLSCTSPSFCNTWVNYSPPAPDKKEALAVLTDSLSTWVGYSNYGVVCYDVDGYVKYSITPKEGLPSGNVTSLAIRDKELWIGTSDGLVCRGEVGGIRVFTVKEGLPDNGITCLSLIGSTIYAGTMKGLVKFSGDSSQFFDETQGLPSAHITAIAPCEGGAVVGTTKGWAIMKGSVFEAHTVTNDGLPFEWISAVSYFKMSKSAMGEDTTTDENWYILGTAGSGLLIYRGGKYKVIRKNDDGPGSDWISSMQFEPENREMWIGTKDGLCCWDTVNGKWKKYNTQNSGLISDKIAQVSVFSVDHSITDYEILKSKNGKCSGCPICCGSNSTSPTSTDDSSNPKPQQPSGLRPGGADGPPVVETSNTTSTAVQTAGDARGAKICPECWKIPLNFKPRKLQRIQTWVGIATDEGANLLKEKKLSHIGQGSFYCYLTNKSWEVKGIGIGLDQVWAGEWTKGLMRQRPPIQGFLYYFVPTRLQFFHVSSEPNPNDFPLVINTLSTNIEGKPIAGGYSVGMGGATVYDPASETWTSYGTRQGLSDPDVRCIYRKGDGLVVGTGRGNCTGCVFCFQDGRFEEVSRKGLSVTALQSMFKRPVTCLSADGDKIFVGTSGDGVYVFDGDSWTRMDSLNTKGLSSDDINAIAYRGSVLYVGTNKGLDCFGPNNSYLHVNITDFNANSNIVQCLLWDDTEGDGEELVLWVGHQDGLLRISKAAGLWAHGGIPHCGPTPGSFFWPAYGRNSENTGGAVYGMVWNASPDPDYDKCPYDGLPEGDVTALAYDDFNLWIGTKNGLGRLRK
ncbi:MAG: hypothetical protein HQM08_11425 [Candidatus Riflebacteria bacterium]|nr:hypothetical protein [Candidatus Riflebacteria bacterium]